MTWYERLTPARVFLTAAALIALIVFAAAGCAARGASFTKSLAIYGYKAESGIEVIEHTVAQLEAAHAPGVTTARAADVMKLAYKAGGLGKQLADALELFDKLGSAEERATSQAGILALVESLSATLGEILKIDLGGTAAQIAALVGNVTGLLDALKIEIAKFHAGASTGTTGLLTMPGAGITVGNGITLTEANLVAAH